MNEVVELSTGHVFAKDSVRVISRSGRTITITGVGFVEKVEAPSESPDQLPHESFLDWATRRNAEVEALRQECVDKLLKGLA